MGEPMQVGNDQRITSGWIEGYCAGRSCCCVFSADACSGKRTAKIKTQCQSPRVMLCQKTKSGNPVSQRQRRGSAGNVELDEKFRDKKKTAPAKGAVSLYIIVLNGFFLCIWILILIFTCDWSLTAALFHSGTLVIRLAVFWHNTHLMDSLPGKSHHIRTIGQRDGLWRALLRLNILDRKECLFVFDKIADLHIDIYSGITNAYLGSNNFATSPETQKIFLDIINNHIVPKTITLNDVNFYQASSEYKPPNLDEEQKRSGIVHAKVRDSSSKTWLNADIYFTFDVRTRGNFLGEQYHFDSVTYSNPQVQEVRVY